MKKLSEKELRKVMSEEEYLEHYKEMVLRKVELGLELKESEEYALGRIMRCEPLSLAGIELVEHYGD